MFSQRTGTRRNSSLRGSLLHTKDRRRRLRSSGLQRPSRVTYVILIVILIVLLAGTLLYWQVLSSLTEFQNADYLKNKLHHVMENAGKIRNPRTKREKGTLHDDEEAKRREKLVKQDTPSKQELLNAVEPQRPVVQAEVARKQEEAQEPVHSTKKEILLLKTSLEDGPGDGVLRLVLRRDLSNESVDYIYTMVEAGCRHRCRFYRAEKPGILQGVIAKDNVPLNKVKGKCPSGFEDVANDCPEWDKSCGCHGPVMQKGYVGWAAGATGPDFFIDNYKNPAKWWGTQHTVWAQIQDEASFAIIDHIWTLPTNKENGMTYLEDPITFQMEIIME